MIENGMSFTLIEAPHPLHDEPRGADPYRDFHRARRVYLGAVPGTDWIHDAIRAEFRSVHYQLEVERNSVSMGLSNEIALITLVLFGLGAVEFAKSFGQRAGEASADAVLDWIREQARERRRETGHERADPPPNFRNQETAVLAEGMRRELAGLIRRRADALEVVTTSRTGSGGLRAVYRDADTGSEYEVAVERDSAIFTRR